LCGPKGKKKEKKQQKDEVKREILGKGGSAQRDVFRPGETQVSRNSINRIERAAAQWEGRHG